MHVKAETRRYCNKRLFKKSFQRQHMIVFIISTQVLQYPLTLVSKEHFPDYKVFAEEFSGYIFTLTISFEHFL